MARLLILVAVQTLFLSGGQVLLKLGMGKLPPFSWTWDYFRQLLTDWWLLACGVSFGVATVLWLYILRHFPFSQAYPLTALAYLFGMVAAIVVFGEQVPLVRWVGALLIVGGCMLVMK
ncbi:MAG: EamA family transporter [Bacteroidales bacterium]|nr:EamA family transporter [Bacteroidales bacterium]MBR3412033.1 EamA family transporter [Bacteroidales bacterium]